MNLKISLTHIIFLYGLFHNIAFCQNSINESINFKIDYEVSFKRYENSKKIRHEKAVLITDNKKSLFIWDNMVKLDSIKNSRELSVVDITTYFNFHPFYIFSENENLAYTEKLHDQYFGYDEKIEYNWSFSNESKIILGFKCKKATLKYGGRLWIAWYAQDIPINQGPYKFRGLPGLILEVVDSEGDFKFNAYSVQKYNEDFKYLIESLDTKEVQSIPHNDFNLLKLKVHSMSWDERNNFMNKEVNTIFESRSINPDTGERIKTRPLRMRNYLEVNF